jgi:hypothetical protein
MRRDSDLILASTRTCLNAGIAALPVHDSLIVPLRCERSRYFGRKLRAPLSDCKSM